MEAIHTLSANLSSVDEFSTAVAGSGWLVDFRQLDRGYEQMGMKVAATESTVALRVDLSSRVHQIAAPPAGTVTFGLPSYPQVAAPPAGTVTFGLPSYPQAPGKLGRRPLGSETLTCFSPHSGLDVVSAHHFSAYTLSFGAKRISELAELSGVPDPSLTPSRNGVQHCPEAAALLLLRRFMEQFFLTLESSGPAALINARLALESDLPLEVLKAWSGSESISYVSRSSRSRVLKRAMEYIRGRSQAVFSVEELCRESACSISTLERAFRDHFGVSPKQYLTVSRLSGVRHCLIDPAEARPIGDIAAAWGFWHMSKFAADYKRMFGELPSATRAVNVKIRDRVPPARLV